MSQSFPLSSSADVLVVELGLNDSSGTDNITLSYGSQTFSRAIQQVSTNSAYIYSDIYYLDNPAFFGSISFTLPATVSEYAFNAFSLSGADTTIAPVTRGNDVTTKTASNSVSLPGVYAGSLAAVDYSIASRGGTFVSNPAALLATSGTAAQSWSFATSAADANFGGGYVYGPSAGNLTVTSMRSTNYLSTSPYKNELAVAVFAPALNNYTWTGAAGNLWSFAGSDLNWSSSGSTASYVEPAAVTFDDTPGANQSVVVSAAVTPRSMTFNNNAYSYSFSSGGGAINGNGPIAVAGGGSVTLALANPAYTGTATVSLGTLQLAHSNALVNATAEVDGANGLGFAPGIGTFNLAALTGSGSFALSDTQGGGVTLQVGGNNASTTFAGSIGGNGNLTKVGSGTLNLTASNNYSGNTVISQGVLIGGAASVGSGAIYLMNGATYRPVSSVPGLTVNIYTPDPGGSAFPATGANQVLFNSVSGVTAFTSTATHVFTGTTTAGTCTGVNFPDVGAGNAFTNIGYSGATNYTAVLTGYIYLPQGVSTLATQSDDGSMLFIDGTAVVNNNGYQAETTRYGSTVSEATAGYHQIEIAFYQGGGAPD